MLLCSVALIHADEKAMFPAYGNYCGKSLTNRYGIKAIDELDRACQIHNSCVSGLGMLDCYCTLQLNWYVMNINPGDRNTNTYTSRTDILRWTAGTSWNPFGGDNLCDNEYHSFDKWYGLAGIVQSTKEGYGFQYHTVTGDKRGHYYGMRNMTYVELTEDQYHNFTKAVGDASDVISFVINLSHVHASNVTFLEAKNNHVLNTNTNNIVVFLNLDSTINLFYYADVPRHGYIPNYYIRSYTQLSMEEKIMLRSIAHSTLPVVIQV